MVSFKSDVTNLIKLIRLTKNSILIRAASVKLINNNHLGMWIKPALSIRALHDKAIIKSFFTGQIQDETD